MKVAEKRILDRGVEGATAPSERRPARLRIDPPALAPRLVHPPRRYTEMIVGIAVMLIAGLAHLTGAAPLISIFLAGLGAVGLAVALRAAAADRLLVSALARKEADSRGELEDLADRMWELRESEERFHGLVDALGDLIVHRDRNGRVVYVNRIFAELLDRDPDTLVGRTLSQLGIDIGLVPDAAFSGGECLSSTDVAIHTRNGMRWYSWIEHSVRDEKAGSVSHRAIARDITARKRAETALINARERAEQASRAKSSFLATVSHEIRTPMNGIMGMATLLADTKLTPEQRTYVGAVSTSASALVALIEDLLDYSKIEAGRLELEPQKISVHDMAENVVELLAARAFAKEIGLGCYIAPDVPATITADPGRLRQVLLNLLGNAVKFTDQGGVAVSLTRGEKNGVPALRIAVADSGPGLEKDDIARIFKDFEQVDGSSTRRHGGAGLGLAITKRIVDAMQGSITVASTPGEGSEFAVLLPLDDASEAARIEPILAHVNAVILSPHVEEAETIAMTIRVHGGRAEIAANAEDAARLAEEAGKPFDTVLIDAALESDDGGLITRLHQSGVGAGRALTLITPSERGRLAAFRASGYGAFLARPVRGKTLLRQLLSEHGEIAGPVGEARETVAGQQALPCSGKAGLRVLVAEDNEINAMLARTALTKAGHQVELVSNGRAAVEAVGSAGERYDVVLMDLHMPVMDGLDAINAIRRQEEEMGLAPVPILVLSADGQEKTRHGVLAHGANGFVTKPVDPDKLLAALEMHAAA